MKEKKQLCGYYNYTVVLTYLGMLTGFTGIICSVEGSFGQAVICLMAAGLCDLFDGTVAATKQRDRREKRFGIQIDSLSDLVSFGVLPALFICRLCQNSPLALLAGSLYLLGALIRLAYYNVLEEERQEQETGPRTWYLGLPVTSAALVLPVFYGTAKHFPLKAELFFPLILLIMAAAFILPIKIRKPCLGKRMASQL